MSIDTQAANPSRVGTKIHIMSKLTDHRQQWLLKNKAIKIRVQQLQRSLSSQKLRERAKAKVQ